jgi:hypothetical protein
MVVATATNPRPSLLALGAHLSYFGFPFYVAKYGFTWQGFKNKLQVEEETARLVKPDTMLVFVDAYDVLVNGTLEQLKQKYKSLAPDGQIVIQHDMNCHPDKSLAPAMRQRMQDVLKGEPRPFCNAGVIIGPAKSFVAIFDKFPIAGYEDDQQYWCKAIIDMPPSNPIIIDTGKSLSLMWRFSPNYSWRALDDGTRVVQLEGGGEPTFVHCPGIDKTQFPRLLRQTRRKGVPGAYRYPVFEIFVLVCVVAFAVLVAMIVLAVLYSRRCAQDRERAPFRRQ